VDALTTQAPAISQTRLITWQELGYFVIITFIGIALYVVFIGIVFGFMSLIGYTFGGMP
jgi:hypothetical protein